MYFDRQIKYLDYMENGDKVRSAGFVKIEVRDSSCTIQISVNGLYPTDTFEREVWIRGGDKECVLGEIKLVNGQGQMKWKQLDVRRLGSDRITFGELDRIQVGISKNRELVCLWQSGAFHSNKGTEQSKSSGDMKAAEAESIPTDKTFPEQSAMDIGDESRSVKESVWPGTGTLAGMNTGAETYVNLLNGSVQSEYQEPMANSERRSGNQEYAAGSGNGTGQTEQRENKEVCSDRSVINTGGNIGTCTEMDNDPVTKSGFTGEMSGYRNLMEEKMPEVSAPAPPEEKVALNNPVLPPRIYEDKWKQLSDIYPHISPFHDERDYLSIGPGDFVILQQNSYKLVSNSFLLHGFYNYGHLILTRIEKKGENCYYIGVPGNFYEREKQVAVMFGFESFECKTEPAQVGDYGYYMIRAEI